MVIKDFRIITMTVTAFCLLLCLLTALIYFFKKKVKTTENSIYTILLYSNISSLVFELLFYFISINGSSFYVYLFEKLFFCANCLWMFFYTLYILVVTSKDSKIFSNNWTIKKKKKFVYIISAIILFIIMVSPIENIYEDGLMVSSAGLSTVLMFFICSGLIVIDIIYVLKSIKVVKKNKVASLLLFLFIIVLEMIASVFGLKLLLITFPMTFASFLMYHTIENPDVKMIEQLEYARDAADKANAAKTDFLSSMSHEIRTPLNAIVGFSDCIKHSDTLDEAKENADDIINASNTLLEIVNGILDISKIEAGKLEIVNSDYNAPDLFSGLGKLITPKMKEKGLDFQVSIAPDLPNTLYGDPASIKKVITNMLSNAYKYTDKGYVKYDVKCVNSNGFCRLIVTVEDSGRGIKKESIDKLFTKFQRVEEDKNTTIEGTGLGLAITKQLIELMGGSIVVTSEYGEGSRFTITLDQRIDNVDVKKESSKVEAIDLTGKKILIVDDNNVNLKVETKFFTRYNAVVTCCNSGFECIDRINKKEEYDIILMDDMMPKMSGTETLNKLKESSSFNIPVVALTANAISGMRERYIESGFDDYLAKPIEIEEVYKVFGKLFETSNVEVLSLNVSSDINNNVDFLEANNIDVKHGLELLGDMEMYNSTMNDFIDEMDTRIPLLDNYKNQNDMPNYAILVHAIKSDCKYLGIMFLADIAYEHELKSKDNDSEFVNKNYDSLISTIEDVLIICKKYLGRD